MSHHLTHLAVFFLAPFFLFFNNEGPKKPGYNFNSISTGGECLQIIDPNTGAASTSFIVDTLCQGNSTDFCLTTTGCNEDVEITNVTGNLGQVIITPPTSPFNDCISYTAPADLVGSDTFILTVTNTRPNGEVITTFIELTYVVVNPQNNTSVTEPVELCSPANSTFLDALNPDPIIEGYWVILQGGGEIDDITNPSIEVTNLPFGESVFMWRQDYPCQSTFDLTTITVYDGQAPVANAGEDVVFCSFDNSYTMQANDPLFSATGTWEITFGNATINDINDPNAEVTGLGIGCNVFEWNINNGPCPGGETMDSIIICVYDQNAPPSYAGEDVEICNSGDNSVLTSALDLDPYDPATGLWTLVSGFGVIEDSDDNATEIENLQIGVNQFVWTVENGDCPGFPSADTLDIRVYDPTHPFPEAGPDISYCAPINEHSLSATAAVSPAIGVWQVISGSGSFSDPNNPQAAVTNLSLGENTFRWFVDNGPCSDDTFYDEVTITVYDPNVEEASAGEDVTICEEDFSPFNLNASQFSAPATGQWSLELPSNLNATDVLSDTNNPNALFNNSAPGEYVLRWTVNNGPCASDANFEEVTVLIYPTNQITADPGEDLELCTPITSFNLNGNTPVAPGIGTWTLLSGSGAIVSPNTPNTGVTNLGVGQNVFRWTIDNGGCGDQNNFNDVTINVFNVDAEPALAGPDQEFCFDGGAILNVQLAANVPQFPAQGEWSIISGSGSFSNINDPNATISAPGFGTNIYQWSIDNGACDVVSNVDQVVIEVFNLFEPEANAGTDISVCSDQASVTLNANEPSDPAQGYWSVVQGAGEFTNDNDPNSAVSGYSLGMNTYRWTITNGPCAPPFTFDDVTVIVYDADVEVANAGEDLEICNNFGPVGLNATPFQAPATGQWTVVSGAGIFSNPFNPNSNVSGWEIGENVYEWSVNNGPCSGGANNDQITITVFDINADQADAGEDQELCTPATSTVLSAVPASAPSTGVWTVESGSGLFLNPNDPNTVVSGLSVGENKFIWTIDNGPCSGIFSQDEVIINLFQEDSATSNAGSDQNFCEPISTATLSANTPESPSTGMWVLVSGTGNINDPTNANTSVSGLTQGINTFSWVVDAGPCVQSDPSDQVSINIFEENHPLADAGDDIEVCTPNSTAQLTGSLPISPAAGTWIQVSGPNSASFDPTSASTEVSNLVPGVYEFQWRIDNGPCDTEPLTDLVTISVYNSNASAANAGNDINLCTPNNFATFSANTPEGAATGEWVLVSGFGSIANVNDPSSDVTNLNVGENQFVWTINNGSCGLGTTSDTISIFVFDNAAPLAFAGEDQSLCSPESVTIVSGNSPVFPASVEWNFISGSGMITSPFEVTTEITGLTIGENVFSYTIYNGDCDTPISTDEISIFVFDTGAPAAFAGDDIELCSNNTFTQMNADPAVDPGVGTWNLVSGDPSVVISNINDPEATISNLQIGTYVFEWSLDYSTCGTQSSLITITVFDINLDDTDAGDDIVLCLPNNTATLNGNTALSPASGTWIILEGSATFSDTNDPNSTVTNLSVGENILAWSVYNGICTPPEDLTDEMSIFVFEEDLTPAFAGIDREICSENGELVELEMTATAATDPGTGSWNVVQGGGTFEDITDPNSVVSDIPVGVNIYEWTVNYSVCAPSTSDTVIISVYNSNEPAANAGPDQSFCTPIPEVTLAANSPSSPATGSWSQIVGTAVFSDITDPNAVITNLGVGVTILRWTINNGPCDPSSTNDLVTIFVYDENAPDALVGEDQELCLPITNSNLQGNLPVFPGIGTWSQIEGTATINNNNNPNSPVSNLSPGINKFVWEVFNGPCANSITTDTLTISVFDPNSPSASAGPDQNLCSFITSASLDAETPISPSTGTWIQVLGQPATIENPNNPNTEISNLSVGVNSFQWSVYNGPCENGISSDVVIINVFDENQEDSFAGNNQELCLPSNSTSFSANDVTLPAVGQWNLISGSGLIQDISDPNSIITDLGVGDNVFSWSINNGPCENGFTSSTVTISVFDPESEAAFTEPDIRECAPVSTIQIAANEALGASEGLWTLVEGSVTLTNAEENIAQLSNLNVGTYTLTWEIDNGACGTSLDTLKVEIFDPNGLPANAGDNQSFCTPVNSTSLEGSTLISPATGIWSVVIGNADILNPSDPETSIENLTVGETILSWTVDNGPCGGITTDFMSIFIFDENAPDADAGLDQEYCLPITETNLNSSPAVFPAIGSWTSLGGTGIIQNINSTNTLVTNLQVGENIFVWTADNGPCENGITRDTVSVFIYPDVFDIANAGPDQSFCSPVNSATASALTPSEPSVGTWVLSQGSGSIVDANDPNTEILQLGIGTNTFSWQVYHGPCDPELTVDFMTIEIFDENHPPADAGLDQEFCLPINSTFLDGNIPSDPVTGEWTLISGTGTITSPTDPQSEITALGAGENILVWSTDNGACPNSITSDTVSIRVFDPNAASADAGEDIAICGESSVILGALTPDSPATGSWNVISGPSSWSIDDPNNPNAELSALVIGEYTLQWIVDNGPCANPISSDQMILKVYDINQPDAFAGDTLRQCSPLNEFSLNALGVTFPSEGTWTIDGTGDISDVNDPFATLSNVTIGEHILTWTVDNGPCGITTDELVVELYDPNSPSANAGPDQQICTDPADGSSATMSANTPISPAYGEWVTIFGTPPVISDINDPNATMTNFGYGETQLQWNIFNGPCESEDSQDVVSIFHFDSNESDAYAGEDQDFCDAPLAVLLDANPTIGNTAVGSWSVSSAPEGSSPLVFLDPLEESTSSTGWDLGVYELTWTVDNGFCGTTTDNVIINIFNPETPSANAGMDAQVCEDEFLEEPSLLLDGNIVDPPASVSWSILEGDALINQNQLNTFSPEVTYLGELLEPLATENNSFIYTVNNGPCGTSTDTVSYLLIDCLTIDVPDAFSPNGDGINDTWEIPNLHKYPDNEIMIFNRWGTKVFETKNYQSDWSGISEHPATIGEELPVGTYYYTLTLGDGSAPYKGFVYLKR